MKDTHKLFDMKGPHELIEDLAAHLAWNSGAALIYEASRAHLIWLHARLRIWESSTRTDVHRRAKALPPSVQQRLLLAPQLFFLLQSTKAPDESSLAAVNSYIEVEELLAGGAGSVSHACWSALGDVCLAPAGDDSKFQRLYEAPRAENVVIDTRSPHYSTEMPEEWGKIGKYSDAESSDFQGKVVDALAFIGRTSSTALTTIDASVRVISGVSTLDKPQLTSAASMKSVIGLMVVANAYSDTLEQGKLADMIVHEAIHSLIYKLELAVPLHTDYSAALSARATSPWTGRSLSLRSFVHACFVWYGLWRFWGLDEKGAESTYYSQSQKGFLHRCPLDGLSKDDRDLIQPYVCSTIETLHRAVNLEAHSESKV